MEQKMNKEEKQIREEIEKRIYIRKNSMIRQVSKSCFVTEGKRDIDLSIKRILGVPQKIDKKKKFNIWSTQYVGKYDDLVNLRLAIMKKLKIDKKDLEVNGWKWDNKEW